MPFREKDLNSSRERERENYIEIGESLLAYLKGVGSYLKEISPLPVRAQNTSCRYRHLGC